MSVQDQAKEAIRWFYRAKRDNGERYARLKDGRPDWVQDLVREAHGDYLPDDWRYEQIWSALDSLAHTDPDADPDDWAHDFADSNVDDYTKDLLAWVASDLKHVGYVDEAMENPESLFDALRTGQYRELEEIAYLVAKYLLERIEDTETGA